MNHRIRSRDEIEKRAYQFWEARGRPWGTPEIDWFEAERELSAGEPESVLSQVAREIGAALGNAVALFTHSDPAPH